MAHGQIIAHQISCNEIGKIFFVTPAWKVGMIFEACVACVKCLIFHTAREMETLSATYTNFENRDFSSQE